jgi:DNA-binding CsgD family transcriptional regulator
VLAAIGGFPAEAERFAEAAIAATERGDAKWDRLESLRARGIAALCVGDAARAAESLRLVWEHTQREGIDDPGAFPVAPDLVEALVEISELEEARRVTARLQKQAEEQEHPWGLATSKRCNGLIRLTTGGDSEAGALALLDAAGEYETLGLHFDESRTLLALGRAQRRLRKWGAARSALERAAVAFDEIGADGWAERARSELARVGGRRPQAEGELTPTERRTAELAAQGLSNKQIAGTLFVSVHTVEVHLSHAYAKLGIRSRAQLARHLARQT